MSTNNKPAFEIFVVREGSNAHALLSAADERHSLAEVAAAIVINYDRDRREARSKSNNKDLDIPWSPMREHCSTLFETIL
jgi:hypothetical protein